MKTVFAVVACLALPALAHAGAPIGIESVRNQIKQDAQSAGYLGKGSNQHLHIDTVKKPAAGQQGLVKVTITTYGSLLPGMKPAQHPFATAEYKTTQAVDGQAATPVKQDGQVWQHMLQANEHVLSTK